MGKKGKPGNGKVALVTGGAVRVGRALSLGLAREGFDVVVHYHSSSAGARSVQEEIRALGRRCVTVKADVADAGQVQDMLEQVRQETGRLDLLVNSASIFKENALLDVEDEEWDQVMGVNLKGPFLTVRAAADLLRAASGCVINIVDVSAIQPWVRYPHHSVSKAGLLHLTRVMARVLAPSVRVNAIAPGTVLPPESADEAENERERQKTLVGHLGSPEDVLRTVIFLEKSNFITGEVVIVDGGMHLNR